MKKLVTDMKFIKLNDDWNAEPNAPMPNIETYDSNLKLTFYLNAFLFEEFDEEDLGILEFYNCRQYRLGPPNEHGYYEFNQCRYKEFGIKWGEFYLIKNSDWKTNFPNPNVISTIIDSEKLNHYLFYFRDETFECVAERYSFQVIKAQIEF